MRFAISRKSCSQLGYIVSMSMRDEERARERKQERKEMMMMKVVKKGGACVGGRLEL